MRKIRFAHIDYVYITIGFQLIITDRSDQVWERIKELCPAVCLYVVPTAGDSVTGTEVTRTQILDWCLTNQFELVQCDDADQDEEEEDDFDEREGKVRIVSALKAHTWSNLELESEDYRRRVPTENDNNDDDSDEDNDIVESLRDINIGGEGEEINFEDLFAQFSKMKEISKNLPEEERKAYAEKVRILNQSKSNKRTIGPWTGLVWFAN